MVNILGNTVAPKIAGKKISGKKFFLSLRMCNFKIWPLETAIIQRNLRLSCKKLWSN